MRAICFFRSLATRREYPLPTNADVPVISKNFFSDNYSIGPKVDMQFRLKGAPCILEPGEQFAEELFDLSNNPSRQAERELLYGTGRSLSTGDIVVVEENSDPEKVSWWLCLDIGWAKL